jgi:hypothetical protein
MSSHFVLFSILDKLPYEEMFTFKTLPTLSLRAIVALERREGIAPTFLKLGTRRGWGDSITSRPRSIPRKETPSVHCTGGWVGPRAGLGAEGTGKILCLCRGSNPGWRQLKLNWILKLRRNVIRLRPNWSWVASGWVGTGVQLKRAERVNKSPASPSCTRTAAKQTFWAGQLSQYSVSLRTERAGFDPRQRQRTFPLISASRPALGPTHPPPSCIMSTGDPSPGGKERPGRHADDSPPIHAKVKKKQEPYLLSYPPPKRLHGV